MPLQPLAVTCISTVPKNPLLQDITPVEALIEPAETLLKDQLNPVLFVAVVAYVVLVVPFINWQPGSAPAETVIGVGAPTVGVIVTDVVAVPGLQPPEAGIVYVTVYIPPALFPGVILPDASMFNPAGADEKVPLENASVPDKFTVYTEASVIQ